MSLKAPEPVKTAFRAAFALRGEAEAIGRKLDIGARRSAFRRKAIVVPSGPEPPLLDEEETFTAFLDGMDSSVALG